MAPPVKAPKKLVRCVTVHGAQQAFRAQDLRFRPAAYGIALRDGQVLVARSKFSGRWEFPGGAVQPWERLEEGLAREYEEETGLPVSVGPCVGFDQGFVAFFQHPFNSIRFFYRVEPGEGELRPQAEEVVEVRWMPVGELSDAIMAHNHYPFLQRVLQADAGETGASVSP